MDPSTNQTSRVPQVLQQAIGLSKNWGEKIVSLLSKNPIAGVATIGVIAAGIIYYLTKERTVPLAKLTNQEVEQLSSNGRFTGTALTSLYGILEEKALVPPTKLLAKNKTPVAGEAKTVQDTVSFLDSSHIGIERAINYANHQKFQFNPEKEAKSLRISILQGDFKMIKSSVIKLLTNGDKDVHNNKTGIKGLKKPLITDRAPEWEKGLSLIGGKPSAEVLAQFPIKKYNRMDPKQIPQVGQLMLLAKERTVEEMYKGTAQEYFYAMVVNYDEKTQEVTVLTKNRDHNQLHKFSNHSDANYLDNEKILKIESKNEVTDDLDNLANLVNECIDAKNVKIKDENQKIDEILSLFNTVKHDSAFEQFKKSLNNPKSCGIVFASTTTLAEKIIAQRVGAGLTSEYQIGKAVKLGEDIQYAFVDKSDIQTVTKLFQEGQVEVKLFPLEELQRCKKSFLLPVGEES